jgi:hypothetical protein
MTVAIGTFLKDLAQKKILVPHINRYLEKGEFPDEWRLSIFPAKPADPFTPTFHPSGDCLLCERQLYKKFTEPRREKENYTSQKNFAVGNFWHAWLQHILVDGLHFSEWKQVERHCEHDGYQESDLLWKGSGSADIICEIPGHGTYLVDFKTMNERHFKADENVIGYLLKKWTYQVNCYMQWLDLDKCVIIGIQKDTPHDFREFVIERDDSLLLPVYDRWTTTALHIRDEVMPLDCMHSEAGDVCPV